MRCVLCGQDYGRTHTCTGIAPMATLDEAAALPPLRFAPVHYFREAVKIVLGRRRSGALRATITPYCGAC
jgi:hypothetical protein